jgi:hypothetical protein
MEVAAEEHEFADELANEPHSESVAAAMKIAQEDHEASVAEQIVQAQYSAKQKDATEEFVREQKDAETESGDLISWIPGENHLNPRVRMKKTARGVQSSNLKAKGKLYVKRGSGKYVLASTVDLIPGEFLYRHRKRAFGQPEKWIVHGKVIKEKSNA